MAFLLRKDEQNDQMVSDETVCVWTASYKFKVQVMVLFQNGSSVLGKEMDWKRMLGLCRIKSVKYLSHFSNIQIKYRI